MTPSACNSSNILRVRVCVGPGQYGDDASGRKHMGGVIGCEKPRLKMPKSTTPGPGAYDVRIQEQSVANGNTQSIFFFFFHLQLAKDQKDTVLHGTFNVTLENPFKVKKYTNSRTQQENHSVIIGV